MLPTLLFGTATHSAILTEQTLPFIAAEMALGKEMRSAMMGQEANVLTNVQDVRLNIEETLPLTFAF